MVKTITVKQESNAECVSDPAAISMGQKKGKPCQGINHFHQNGGNPEQQFNSFMRTNTAPTNCCLEINTEGSIPFFTYALCACVLNACQESSIKVLQEAEKR